MNMWIWDGKMDCGWEDLSALLMTNCQRFTDTMARTTEISPNAESQQLISANCMKRFENITGLLAEIVKEGDTYAYEDLEEHEQNASKLNGWILLGSLTETTLQMFMAFYIENYRETQWQQWVDFKVKEVKEPIFECIQNLVKEDILESEQAKSLKEAIKKKIREHTKEHPIQKVMLDELIQLYQQLELMDEDEISYLRSIQSNRNGIHAFENREIGSWHDLQFGIRFFCYLLEWVLYHLPDIPDFEEYY